MSFRLNDKTDDLPEEALCYTVGMANFFKWGVKFKVVARKNVGY